MTRFRPRALDVGIAAGLGGLGLVEGVVAPTGAPLWLHESLVVVVATALAFRRRYPLLALGVAAGVMAVLSPEAHLSLFGAVVLAAFTVGLETEGVRSYVGLALGTVPFYTGYAVTGPQVSDLVAITVLYGGSWAVGRMVREHVRRAAEHAARADRAEREHAELAARAVADERTRIARELHDIVAHSLSVVTLQTQAVRRRLDPSLAREIADLQAAETAARQAMAEVRRLFGMLRSDGERPSLEPQPGLDQLDRLVGEARAAGTPVEVVLEGTPVPLSPGHGLAAYRVVQEALTNVRKHAPGAAVTVRLRYAPGELEVAVHDRGGVALHGADGAGFGLVGMRERVGLYGGSLEAQPTADGFAVRAVLPLREGAPV